MASGGPIAAHCLPRSLVVWWMLADVGYAPSWQIGVGKDGERLLAHAWVELDGAPALDDSEGTAAGFAPLDRAGWQPPERPTSHALSMCVRADNSICKCHIATLRNP